MRGARVGCVTGLSRCSLKICLSELLKAFLRNADRLGTFIDDQIELSTLYGQMLRRQIFFQTLDNTTKNRLHAGLPWKERRYNEQECATTCSTL